MRELVSLYCEFLWALSLATNVCQRVLLPLRLRSLLKFLDGVLRFWTLGCRFHIKIGLQEIFNLLKPSSFLSKVSNAIEEGSLMLTIPPSDRLNGLRPHPILLILISQIKVNALPFLGNSLLTSKHLQQYPIGILLDFDS